MSVSARRPSHRTTVSTGRAWVIAAVLLLVAGMTGTAATFWHWIDCRAGLATPSCLVLQEQTGTLPLLTTVGPTSVVLLGGFCALGVAAAWAVALVAARLRPPTTGCGLLVGLQPTVAAVVVLGQPLLPGLTEAVLGSLWFYLLPDLAAVVFVGLILKEDEVRSDRARWLVLTVAVTVFGAVPALVENLALAFWRPGIADAVPGTGYGLAALLVGCGGGLLAASVGAATRGPHPAPPSSRPRRSNLVTAGAQAA